MSTIVRGFLTKRNRFGIGRRRRVGRIGARPLLRVEPLEDRCLLTTITLAPSKDNTLIESTAGDLSNGTGNVFVGETNSHGARRGVMAFNTAGNIPAGARINSVSLTLNAVKTHGPGITVELHKLSADWGEGTSFSGSGVGDASTTNDATWIHRFYPTSMWANPGGDFSTTVSASLSVSGTGSYTWSSTTQLVADVQSWVDNASTNFGWLLLGNESTGGRAKEFGSRENSSAAPALTIDYTAGFTAVTLSGQVYHDLNGNGSKDAGEAGLQGWTVFLDTNNNGTLDSGEPSTTTDSSGNYSFANIGAGTYRVREVVQAGFQQTTANPADIVPQSGVNVTGKDFGNFKQITISGQLFSDLNANGAKDSGEPGLSGWTVFLDSNNNGTLDSGEANTTTDANGNYSFANLGPGTYRVREVAQTGFAQTTTNPADIVASSGMNVTSVSLGNARPGIYGQVFEDLNGNGVKDPGEAGLSGWTVYLDTNDNGQLETGETSVTTNANGEYAFTSLASGTYGVREVLPSGWQQSRPGLPNFKLTASVTTTQISTGRDFGNFRPVQIGGTAFEDLNGNGTKDAGEPAQSGWTVFLDQNNNGLLDKGQITLVSSDAPKALPDLSTTTSTLAVSGLPGQISSLSVLLNITHTFDSDLTAFLVSPVGIRVRLFSHVGDGGQNFTNTLLDDNAGVAISAGNAPFLGSFQPDGQLSALKGQSPNGTWTLEITDDRPGDSGTLQGWSLTVGFAEVSTTTDASGAYALAGLAPGTYNVREVVQAGWQQSQPAGPNFGYGVTLTSGQSTTGRDFGNDRRSQISGTVFNDANSNGVKETGEAGLPGWVVYLDSNGNGVLDQRTVPAAATDVPKPIPDVSTITSTAPVGKGLGRILSLTVTLNITHPKDSDLIVFLTSPAGTRLSLFSQVGAGGANFVNTVLDDAAPTAITAGSAPFTGSFRPTGALASFLGQDPAGSWALEITDSAAPNTGTLNSWSLNFILATEPIAVSNASGAYSFTNLNPGGYTVREVAQAGWTQTLPASPGLKYTVALNSGQPVGNQDFGNTHTGGGGGTPLIGDSSDESPVDGTKEVDTVLALLAQDRFSGVVQLSLRVGGAALEMSSQLPRTELPRSTFGVDTLLSPELRPESVDQLFADRGRLSRADLSNGSSAGESLTEFLAPELDCLFG